MRDFPTLLKPKLNIISIVCSCLLLYALTLLPRLNTRQFVKQTYAYMQLIIHLENLPHTFLEKSAKSQEFRKYCDTIKYIRSATKHIHIVFKPLLHQ